VRQKFLEPYLSHGRMRPLGPVATTSEVHWNAKSGGEDRPRVRPAYGLGSGLWRGLRRLILTYAPVERASKRLRGADPCRGRDDQAHHSDLRLC
jgi:hypothetical protein